MATLIFQPLFALLELMLGYMSPATAGTVTGRNVALKRLAE